MFQVRNVDEVAGARVVAGVKVLGAGSGRAMAGGATGLLFGGRRDSPLGLRQIGYLAVADDRLLLMSIKPSRSGHTATGVLATVPKEAIASVEVRRRLTMSLLVLTLADGGMWTFEVTKPNVRKARAVRNAATPATAPPR